MMLYVLEFLVFGRVLKYPMERKRTLGSIRAQLSRSAM